MLKRLFKDLKSLFSSGDLTAEVKPDSLTPQAAKATTTETEKQEKQMPTSTFIAVRHARRNAGVDAENRDRTGLSRGDVVRISSEDGSTISRKIFKVPAAAANLRETLSPDSLVIYLTKSDFGKLGIRSGEEVKVTTPQAATTPQTATHDEPIPASPAKTKVKTSKPVSKIEAIREAARKLGKGGKIFSSKDLIAELGEPADVYPLTQQGFLVRVNGEKGKYKLA